MEEMRTASPRQVLPRWRELRRTPSQELGHLAVPVKLPAAPASANIWLRRWKSSHRLEDAADALDYAIYSSNTDGMSAAVKMILNPDSGASAALRETAKTFVQLRHAGGVVLGPQSVNSEGMGIAIHKLKARINDSPRDALAQVDLARLYFLQGQLLPARRYVHRAVALAPDNRFVIRSAARFFMGTDEPDKAHKIVADSSLVRYDPWIQAVEISVSEAIKRTPKWAIRDASRLQSQDLGEGGSELAAALATFSFNSGERLKVTKKILRSALRHPTENALAQAVWLGRQLGSSLDVASFLSSIRNANEARAIAALFSHDAKSALVETTNWLKDEPYSVRAAGILINLLINQKLDYDAALSQARAIRKIFPSSWGFLNSETVCLVFLGRFDEATLSLSQLRSYSYDSNVLPFIHAAEGLLAFHERRFEDGRNGYRASIEASRLIHNPTLELYAQLYWAEQELRFGGYDPARFLSDAASIAHLAGKLPELSKADVIMTLEGRLVGLRDYLEVDANRVLV